MKDANKVGTACGFGGLIGTLIALQFGHVWWLTVLGLVVGGVVGYLTYEFKTVLSSARKVFEDIYNFKINWRKTGSVVGIGSLYFLGLPITVIGIFLSTGIILRVPNPDLYNPCMLGITLLLWLLSAMLSYDDTLDNVIIFVKRTNPMSIIYYTIKYTFVSIWWVLSRIPTFVWNVIIRIHSEKRTICFVDSVLGTLFGVAVGYYTNTVNIACVAGAVSGYLLGIVNYQIVSVRWLKLKPA